MQYEFFTERLHPNPTGKLDGNMIYYEAQRDELIDQAGFTGALVLEDSFQVFDEVKADLTAVPRWESFRIPPTEGDANTGTHSVRQTITTLIALSYGDLAGETPYASRMMVAVAQIHDIGEKVKGDIPAPEKTKQHDLAEAAEALAIIDESAVDAPFKNRLKEAYIRIATHLDADDLIALMGNSGAALPDSVDWNNLRNLFSLYERIGYTVTAIQQLGLLPSPCEITDQNRQILHNGAVDYHKAGQIDCESTRRLLLYKEIPAAYLPRFAQSGVPSATAFFHEVGSMIQNVDDLAPGLNLSSIHGGLFNGTRTEVVL